MTNSVNFPVVSSVGHVNVGTMLVHNSDFGPNLFGEEVAEHRARR